MTLLFIQHCDVHMTLAQRVERGADMRGVIRKGRRGKDIVSFTLRKLLLGKLLWKIQILISVERQL